MRIAEFAAHADVEISTVRFDERRGVLESPPRTQGGYRDYDEHALARLRFLRRGQELSFTLQQLGDFVSMSADARAGTADPADVRRVATEKLLEIDHRIRDLERTRIATTGLLADPCLDPTEACPIIAALAGEPRESPSLVQADSGAGLTPEQAAPRAS